MVTLFTLYTLYTLYLPRLICVECKQCDRMIYRKCIEVDEVQFIFHLLCCDHMQWDDTLIHMAAIT